MTNHQVLSLVGLTLLGMFLLAVGWEFAVENLVSDILFDAHEKESPRERWEYVITATSFVGIALIIPTLLSLRLVKNEERAKKKLQNDEKKYRTFMESANIIPWEADAATFQFTYVGPQAVALLGYPVENWYQNDFWPKHIHPEDREEVVTSCLEATHRGEDNDFEYRMFAADGRTIWLRDIVVIVDKPGAAKTLHGVMIDITEHKNVEAALRESGERFRTLVEHAPEAITMLDVDTGLYLDANPMAETLHGFPREELIGNIGPADLSPEIQLDGRPSSEAAADYLSRALAGEFPRFEWMHLTPDGQETLCEVSLARLPDPHRNLVRASIFDITKRKEAEEALQESEKRFKDYARTSSDYFFEMDKNLRFSYFSDRFKEVADISPQELLGKTRQETGIPGFDDEELHRHLADLEAHRPFRNFIHPRTHQDGNVVYLSISGVPVFDVDGNFSGYRCSGTDITKLKKGEAQERGKNRVLELLAIAGSLEEVLSLLITTAEEISPDMLGSVLLLDEGGKHLLHGAAPSLPDFYNKAIHGMEIGDGEGSCGTAAETGKTVIVEDIMTHPYWTDFCDLASKADLKACWSQPILTAAGKVLGTFAMYYREPRRPRPEDIKNIEDAAHLAGIAIEHKQMEEKIRESEEKYRHFSADVAHELRTPLAVLRSHIDSLGDSKTIQILCEEVDTMSRLVSQLLTFAQLDSMTVSSDDKADLREICLNEAKRLAPIAIKEGRSIEVTGVNCPVIVRGNANVLELAVRNLIENAIRYSNRGSTVTINVSDEPAISVINLGRGISAENQKNIFNRFKRADQRSGGVGLGLSIVKRVADHHGGAIEITDASGGGTVFTIRLPATKVPKAIVVS